MKRSIAVAILLACRFVLADNVFDQIAGRYPVYAVDGDEHVTGALEIFSGSKGVGYRMSELSQAPGLENTPLEIVTPLKDTVIRKEGNQIVQEFKNDDVSVRIEYERKGTEVVIQASRCPKGGNCELNVVNNGNGIGDVMAPQAFFSSVLGKYKIERAGAGPGHEGVNADVSLSGEEANLSFPYCPEAGGSCDPGYIDLTLSDTKVTKRSIDRSQVMATIQWDGKVYTWEERDVKEADGNVVRKVFFRNYQYVNAEDKFFILSHVLTRISQ